MPLLEIWAAYGGGIEVGEQRDGQQFTLQWESSVEDLVDDRAATTGYMGK